MSLKVMEFGMRKLCGNSEKKWFAKTPYAVFVSELGTGVSMVIRSGWYLIDII